jgi:RNA polymerase sigma factor for flagellar operon FliA
MTNPYSNLISVDRLIEGNTNLVKKYAYFYAGRVQKAAEVEDLLQVGMIGLIEAAHNYEQKEGVAFESYARLRIKGAIVDYLRKSSNLCRTTVKQKQDTDKAKRLLELKFGRLPYSSEVAEELQITTSDLASWEHNFAANQNQSIDEVTELYGEFIFSKEPNVEEKIFNGELKTYLRNAMSQLNKQQTLVVELYYVKELNVYEIAEILSVSTGRVSQIKSAAIDILRRTVELELT